MKKLAAVATTLLFGLVVLTEPAPSHAHSICNIAGTGEKRSAIDSSGDGGLASDAKLVHPLAVEFMPDGGFLIVEPLTNSIRRVAPDGTLSTLLGTGNYRSYSDPLTPESLRHPRSVSVTKQGGVLVADTYNHRILLLSPLGSTGERTLTRVAGTGVAGFNGDGDDATRIQLHSPEGVKATPDGGFMISDTVNHRIRYVFPPNADGLRRTGTLVGTGERGTAGDGGRPERAEVDHPGVVALGTEGDFVFLDWGHLVRRVYYSTPENAARIETIVGTGSAEFNGDDQPAQMTHINYPWGIASTGSRSWVFSDSRNHIVRETTAFLWGKTVQTVAGVKPLRWRERLADAEEDDPPKYNGDHDPATEARLGVPAGIAVAPDGSYLLADYDNHRIRLISPPKQVLTEEEEHVEKTWQLLRETGFTASPGRLQFIRPQIRPQIGWRNLKSKLAKCQAAAN